MGYKGILGHEAVGIVEEINDEDQSLLGKRVVSEISYGCKDPNCSYCAEKCTATALTDTPLEFGEKTVVLHNTSQCL